MLSTRFLAGVGALALIAATAPAQAGGMYQTLPVIGGSSYCASTVTGTGGLSGPTGQGQGTVGSICGQTVPAGPPTLTGNETVAADLFAPGSQIMAGGPSTALMSVLQLGAGHVVIEAPAATYAMLTGDSTVILNGTTASAITVTLPPNPIDGQVADIRCESATTGTVNIAVNAAPASTVLVPARSAAACVASTGFRYTYNAANNIWYLTGL